jgi:hypothetical protein
MFELMIVICLADSPIHCTRSVDTRTKYRTEEECHENAHNVILETVDFLYSRKMNEDFYIERWMCRNPMTEAN